MAFKNLIQTNHTYPMPDPDCYIYFYHTGDFIILPTYPDTIADSQTVTYSSETPLGRSAPIFSYENSGPRTILFSFNLHRDMMWQLNYSNSSISVGDQQGIDDDYVDVMIKKIQGAALPEYSMSEKMVNPPIVAVKIGNEIFIKGVVNGSVGVDYDQPILRSGKYALVKIQFLVSEVVPYTASKAVELGGFRTMDQSLITNNIYSISAAKTIDYAVAREAHSQAAAATQAAYYARGGIGAEGTLGG